MTVTEAILELKGIHKRFGELEALKGVDLSVLKGEFFGFLGPNGAGKSTLMKILSGFLEADAGDVLIRGRKVEFRNHASRRDFGLVPQEIALYDSLSPLDNLRIFAQLYGLPWKSAAKRAGELLQEVRLWERRNDRVKDFSGGMKRRLNIVVSLLHEPDILLCDEPTVGVDPQSRNAIFTFLESLNRSGLTVLYTTHYMEEAERLCPRIAIIDHGRILACGKQADLLKSACSELEVVISKGPQVVPFIAVAGCFGRVMEDELVYRITPQAGLRLSELYAEAERTGLNYDQVKVRAPSLENLFLKLTGHKLRE